ncbi:hypothetical protein VN97_g4170 [Penicillium thymicola]|uniref:Uncharacterized protein n=1 Tax=Penicillium thymicola TaxID=293382 RepID=A0AAI9XAE8_PENTH|nr:hypothetical protein VN97_g4170 [Penicillium thymicola]
MKDTGWTRIPGHGSCNDVVYTGQGSETNISNIYALICLNICRLQLNTSNFLERQSTLGDVGIALKIQKDLMVNFGKQFVEKGIEELAARWAKDSNKEKAEVVNQVLKLLREKTGQIYMNDWEVELQPSWE